MNRLHLHVGVTDINQSIQFYSTLFGAAPNVIKNDYAKWTLDDPSVNFAISARGAAPGLNHVGIQTEDAGELAEITARLKSAGAATFEQQDATCCYAQSDKTWVQDPSGLRWETFHTYGEATKYGADASIAAMAEAQLKPTSTSCCG
jgi:hypothetical protein